MKRFQLPWQLLTGITLGALVGVTLAAPLLGWELPDSSATMLGSALGAAAAVFGAFWLQRHEAAERRVDQTEEDRRRLDSLVMTLAPLLSYFNQKLPSIMKIMEGLAGKPAVSRELYDRLREPFFNSLGRYVPDFHLLPIAVRYDAMQLAAWGELYNALVADCAIVDDDVTRRTGIEYIRILGSFDPLKSLLEKILALQQTVSREVEPLHDAAVARGNAAQAQRPK
jgi:hypothetical protein